MLTCITFNCPLPGMLHPCPAHVLSSTCQSHRYESRNNTSVQGPPDNCGGLWLSLKLTHLGVSALRPMCGEWCDLWFGGIGVVQPEVLLRLVRSSSHPELVIGIFCGKQWKCLLLACYLKAWSQLAASAAKWELISPVGNTISIRLWLWYFLMLMFC